MGQARQTQARQQGQQTPVGQGTGVVCWLGLTTKCKSHRLRCRTPGQGIHRIPSRCQGQAQHGDKRQAGKKIFPTRGSPTQKPCTQPVRQQSQLWISLAKQGGFEPGSGFTHGRIGQLKHVAKGLNVLGFPWRSPQKTGQHIGDAKQQQSQARQSAYGALRNDGGGGMVHVWIRVSMMGR